MFNQNYVQYMKKTFVVGSSNWYKISYALPYCQGHFICFKHCIITHLEPVLQSDTTIYLNKDSDIKNECKMSILALLAI